jgi:hypothetical protein
VDANGSRRGIEIGLQHLDYGLAVPPQRRAPIDLDPRSRIDLHPPIDR